MPCRSSGCGHELKEERVGSTVMYVLRLSGISGQYPTYRSDPVVPDVALDPVVNRAGFSEDASC